MRVLHVLTTLSGGGAEGFVASLLPQLREQGLACGLMAVYSSDPPFDPAAEGIDVLQIGRRTRYDPGFLPRMVARMRAWRPDVVHTHLHNGKYWGRLAALMAGVPAIVHTVHNPCDTYRITGGPIADRFLNAASAAVVTFSPEQGRFLCALERLDPAKLAIIPNGIHLEPPATADLRKQMRGALGLHAGEYAVFVVGTLYGPKNQRLAVEALNALSPQLRERVRLCIIGDGEDRAMLESLVAALGLRDRVAFFGRRSNVVQLLAAADLLLMPSLSEGMPLALLEAMSAGVPTVSTPWIGARDLLGNGAFGVLAGGFTPAAVATALAQAMQDPGRTRALAVRATERARTEYDIRITARRHHDLYDALLFSRKAA
jgi:glycosyltransferase involved in cell wall biosynthesis